FVVHDLPLAPGERLRFGVNFNDSTPAEMIFTFEDGTQGYLVSASDQEVYQITSKEMLRPMDADTLRGLEEAISYEKPLLWRLIQWYSKASLLIFPALIIAYVKRCRVRDRTTAH